MYKPPERSDAEAKPPGRRRQQPVPNPHHPKLFEWLFVALIPTAALLIILSSEFTLRRIEAAFEAVLRRIEAALSTPYQPTETVTPAPTHTGDLPRIRIARIEQASPTEVRITGEGLQPLRPLFVAVRAPASDMRTIKAEAFQLGGGAWSAVVRLSNAGCRENVDGVARDHLTFLLSLITPASDQPMAIGGLEPVTGAPETELHLTC